jgi:flagellar biosynthetic protein FliS
VNAIYGAIPAIEANEIEKKMLELNHAFALLSHLQNALEFKKGGNVALPLDRFYNLARERMLDASGENSGKVLTQVAEDFLSVREAWQEVECPTGIARKMIDPAIQPGQNDAEQPSRAPNASVSWTA